MNYKEIKQTTLSMLRSSQGRNILTFLVFLLISLSFWLLLALNDEVQHDYSMQIKIDDLPRNTTIISGFDSRINLTVRDKGASLMKFNLGNDPILKIHYDDFIPQSDTLLLITSAQLNSAVRNVFGSNADIIAMRPDSLLVTITNRPGITVPVNVRADVHTSPQSYYSGHPIITPDSVAIFSTSGRNLRMKSIPTEVISLDGITDTVTHKIRIATPRGVRAIPEYVNVTFPTEPLVAKQHTVPITIKNIPAGIRVITFPAVVDISYVLPKSMYGADPGKIHASVDYNDINSSTRFLNVTIPHLSSKFQSVVVQPAQVEYVIEHVD